MMRPTHAARLCILVAALACLACAVPDTSNAAQEQTPTIERLDTKLNELIPIDVRVEEYARDIIWAEGPLWDAERKGLLFSDVPRNGIYLASGGAAATLIHPASGYTGAASFTGREPGSNGLTFDAKERLVYCRHGERDIARREPDGRISVLVDRFRGQRFNSPNDLVYDSKGNLYFTDPHFGLPGGMDDPTKELRFQGVYRLSVEGKIDAIVTDLEAPNGVALSPDERTLYVANATKTRPIWMAYTIGKDGAVRDARQFAEASRYVADGKGVPDGLKVDQQGNVFATGPSGVHIFAPDGTRLGRIVTHVPTGNVAWGEDGSVLFIAANHRILRVQTSTRGSLPQNVGARP